MKISTAAQIVFRAAFCVALAGCSESKLPDPSSSQDAGVNGTVDAAADAPLAAQGRNVLLLIFDDIGAEEIRSYASDLAKIARANPTSVGIKDTNSNRIPDGLEDTNNDGQPDGAIATPAIDSLASAGVRFTQVWSHPTCSPTRAGIYTGRYVIHHGVGEPIGNPSTVWALPHDVPTLPEILKSEGSRYKTALLGKWHLGSIDGTLPTDRGWDYFAGSTDGKIDDYYRWKKVVVDEARKRTNSVETAYATTVAIDEALGWIGKQSGPWWATVALNAAHTPYAEPPASCLSGKISGTDDVALFHKTFECADHEVARLLGGIEPAKLANTTIVFIGDNGTEGSATEVYQNTRAKTQVYQGGVHVPMIVADGALLAHTSGLGLGAVVNPGRTITSPTHTVDIFATIAAIMGSTKALSTDSTSFVDTLGSSSAPALRTMAYTDAIGYQAGDVTALNKSLANPATLTLAQVLTLKRATVRGAMRTAKYKLIYDSGSYKLFDLTNDPFEQASVWCTSAEAKTQGEQLATALAALDTMYPATKCP